MNKLIFTFKFDGHRFNVSAWAYEDAFKVACLKTGSVLALLVKMKLSNK